MNGYIILIVAMCSLIIGIVIGCVVETCIEHPNDKFKKCEPEKIKYSQVLVGDFVKAPYNGYGVVIHKYMGFASSNAGTVRCGCADILTTEGRVKGCTNTEYYRLGHFQTLKSVSNHFLHRSGSFEELFDLKISTHLGEHFW